VVETCYCPPPMSLGFSQSRRGYRRILAQNAASCKASATEGWAEQWVGPMVFMGGTYS